MWVNPAQPPSVSRCAPRSRSPVSLIVLQDPARAGGDPVLLPPLVWRVRCIYLFIQDEGTFGEWLDELPFEVAAATARLLKHHARSGAWVELSPGNPSQASRAGRDRDRSSPNCPSDMSELSENSD